MAYPEGYLDHVKNTVGSKEFRGLDPYKGRYACAIFVSHVLKEFGLIGETHNLVDVVVHNLSIFGWRRITLEDVQPGDIIVYVKKKKSGRRHIGFFVERSSEFDKSQVVSNNWKARTPVIHDIYCPATGPIKGKRRILMALTYKTIGGESE